MGDVTPRPGKYNRWVTLSQVPADDTHGTGDPLDPEWVPCFLQPTAGGNDSRTSAYVVELRFHPQITIDTRLTYYDEVLLKTREFFVRGVQNLDEANVVLRLFCEEVSP